MRVSGSTSFQCRSSLFLNELTDGASTTCCGNWFQCSMTRWLKKCFLTFNLTFGIYSFILCPRRLCPESHSLKNWFGSICSFNMFLADYGSVLWASSSFVNIRKLWYRSNGLGCQEMSESRIMSGSGELYQSV